MKIYREFQTDLFKMINENFFYNKIKSKNTFQFNLNETSKYKNISKIPILPTKRTLTNPNNISIPEHTITKDKSDQRKIYPSVYSQSLTRNLKKPPQLFLARLAKTSREEGATNTAHLFIVALPHVCATLHPSSTRVPKVHRPELHPQYSPFPSR